MWSEASPQLGAAFYGLTGKPGNLHGKHLCVGLSFSFCFARPPAPVFLS